MPPDAAQLTVAISSRALFDLEESHRVFETEGIAAYCAYQIERESEALRPGVAFTLVRKLLQINNSDGKPFAQVVLVSRNSADTGLRVFNSIAHHGLNIKSAAFTGGRDPWRYIPPFDTDLFLSANPGSVREVLREGYAAATILPSRTAGADNGPLRIAFDGDAVLFSDEAERVYQAGGVGAFLDSETAAARRPLSGGPFKNVLAALHRIQSDFPAAPPLRTALVTSRSAPAHERVIRTLRAWDIRIDEALFLEGRDKGKFLDAFGADIFFDDQSGHCDSARGHVPTAHVPHGGVND